MKVLCHLGLSSIANVINGGAGSWMMAADTPFSNTARCVLFQIHDGLPQWN